MARPSKFTEESRKVILENLETGTSREVASRASGVDPETVRKWIRKGEEETTGDYYQFAIDVGKAETTAEVNMLKILTGAKSWQAAAWWLERRRPLDYGRHANKMAPMKPSKIDVMFEDLMN